MAYHAPEETWEETAYYGKNHEAYNCNSADRQQIILLRSLDGMIVIAEIILTVDPDRPEMEHGS